MRLTLLLRHYNYMVKPSDLENNANYHLFKKGTTPILLLFRYLVVYSCPFPPPSPKELNRCGRTQRTQRWGTCVSISADILTSIILQGWQMDHTDKEKPSTMWPTLGKFGTQLNIHQKKGHNKFSCSSWRLPQPIIGLGDDRRDNRGHWRNCWSCSIKVSLRDYTCHHMFL